MNIKKHLTLAGLLLISSLMITSCDDDDKDDVAAAAGKSTLKFNLTDAPASYDAVLIDVQQVEVHVETTDSSTNGWHTMTNVQPGIYDLLDFQNGLDTLIASGDVPSGKISQIRLILGAQNSVVVDGVSEDLKTPSAQQSGLKLQVHQTLEPGLVYEFWIDFDASRSIVEQGNGGYLLKPVIRVYTANTTGSIDGYITPDTVLTSVLAYNAAGDSATALSNVQNGYFLISGLNPATYTVEFDPQAPFVPKDTTGVNVVTGTVTHMGSVNL